MNTWVQAPRGHVLLCSMSQLLPSHLPRLGCPVPACPTLSVLSPLISYLQSLSLPHSLALNFFKTLLLPSRSEVENNLG